MSLWSEQDLYCSICGRDFKAEMPRLLGHIPVCGRICFDEYKWREVLSIMGHTYAPDPKRADNIRGGDV